MSNNKRNNKRSRGSFAAAGTSSTTSSSSAPSRARKVGRGHPGYAYFEREMHPVLKPLNKLYNFPSWAMNPKHAETDRSLMLRKVQGYLVEIGDHVARTFGAERHAEAWEYVAEKAEAKLRGPVLRRLYGDIVARNLQEAAGGEGEDGEEVAEAAAAAAVAAPKVENDGDSGSTGDGLKSSR